MKLVPVRVTIINLSDWRQILRDARELTRPNSNEPPEELLKLDAPIGDLPTVVLCFQAPILLREVITSFRDLGVWSQSTRVLNLENWDIVEGLSDYEYGRIDYDLKYYFDLESISKTQDLARMWLPTSHVSKFIVRISLRTLVKLYHYFNHLEKNAQGHIKGVIRQMCDELFNVMESIFFDLFDDGFKNLAYIDDLLKSINFVEVLPEINGHFSTSGDGDSITVCTTLPIAMRAQVIRHRMFQVVDDFKSLFQEEHILSTPIKKQIRVKISANTSVWKEVARTRNCWLAQGELWSPILREVNGIMLKSGNGMELPLPCSHGVCTYHAECMKRLNKDEPGLPCPRHIILRDKMGDKEPSQLWDSNFVKQSTDNQKAALEKYAIESSRPHLYWLRQINAIKEQV